MNCSMAERPWPPHSLGQPMPSQPSLPICLTTLRMTGPMPSGVGELLLELGGEQVLVVGAQLALQRLLLLGVGNLHVSLPGGGAASAHVSAMSSPARHQGLGAENTLQSALLGQPMGPDGAIPTDE